MYRIVLLTSLLPLFYSFTTEQAAKAPIVEWVGGRAYDFGSVLSGATVSVGFEFINVSKDSILLQTARTTCGCTAAKWPEKPIAPGEKATILIEYDADRTGAFQKKIKVFFDKQRRPEVLTIRGEVEE